MGRKSRAKKQRRAAGVVHSSDAGTVVVRGSDLPHLYVGVPAYRMVNPETATSLLKLVGDYPGAIGFEVLSGCYIEHARNNIAKMAQDAGADRLLFVDSDMQFKYEDFIRLSDDLDKDPGMGAVCGIYVGWGGANRLICGWMDEEGDLGMEYDQQIKGWEHVENGDIVEVDKAGTGFMLIDMDVFEKIPPVWFATMVEAGSFWGEDTYFIHLLKHHGYRPSCDFRVRVKHVGPQVSKVEHDSPTTQEQIQGYKELRRRANETNKEVSN
jgi:hypothetical protein